MTTLCSLWRDPARRCKFCSIGLNARDELPTKSLEQILEAVDAAYHDARAPARHILLGGGTPDGDDSGAAAIALAAQAIKQRWSRSIYAMIAPPKDLDWIDRLHQAGVDELGMNLELFDQHVARQIVPGKFADHGLPGYERALTRAVKVFGPINTRSIMVVGLESDEQTLAGVEWLAAMGVMPILSPFRPLAGTTLESQPRMPPAELWALTEEAARRMEKYGIPLGPTCRACQSNTLTAGDHPLYRAY